MSDAHQPPLMERLSAVMDAPGGRIWLIRWAVLALIVLGTAGLFALPLAFGRAPGLSDHFPWFVENFHRFLVLHVDYSFVVFFLCIFAAVAHITAYRLSGGAPKNVILQYIAFRMAVVAVAGMFIPVFLMPEGEPVMSNYVPVLTSPLFYLSLVVLAASMALMAMYVLINLLRRTTSAASGHGPGIDVLSLAGIAAALIYLLALSYFLYAWSLLDGQPVTHQFNEELFWAGGHVLQFLNVVLLAGAWYAVGAAVLNRTPFSPIAAVLAIALVTFAAFTTPLFFIIFEAFSADWLMAFTDAQYAFAPATLVVAVPMIISVLKVTDKPWTNPGYATLILSPIVFGIGGVMGLFVDGQDTRTPAHYHSVIAGVTLAFMALFYVVFIPLLKRRILYPRLSLASVWLFGVGQALASSGLFIAGGHGAARKTAGAAQELTEFSAKLGMGLNGGAGLLAIIGGALFVWVTATALIAKESER